MIRDTFINTIPFNKEYLKLVKSGWGCGYVHIPKEHPILVKLLLNQDGYYYLQPEDCEQEITWSNWDKDNDYYVIGFDTGHIHNNPSHDKEYVTQETKKIKTLVDSYTKEHAKKEVEDYFTVLKYKFKDYL